MPGRQTKTSKAGNTPHRKPTLDTESNKVAMALPEDAVPVGEPSVDQGKDVEPQPDDWAEFFVEEAEGNVIVQMRRILPDITVHDPETGADIRTAGYCEDLPPGLSSYQDYIKRRYGGGTYQVQKRVAGRIAKQRNVLIQGKPILDQPPTEPLSPASDPLPTEIVDDINIGGTDGDWMRRMERLMAMKKVLAEPAPPPSIDQGLLQTLLTFILGQKTPDPLTQVQTVTSLIASLKEITPETSTGASVTDILNTAVKTVGQLLISSPRKALPVGSLPVIHRPQIGKPPGAPPFSDGQQTTPEEINQMSQTPQTRELAGLAIQTIVTSFRLQPPIPVDRVVAMLDSSVSMSKEQRAELLPFKQVLFDLAETQLEEDFSAEVKKRESFQAYFYAVFDEFVRPDREVVAL